MEPTPQPTPKQPNPADTTLPTKGAADSQSASTAPVPSGPRPETTPSAPGAGPLTRTGEPTPESEASSHDATAPADPSAADIQPDTGGDVDPSASNIGDVQPL